ncbi:hypothetical protein JMI89_09645 [Frischella sp. Ac48]|uniref:C2H2-type domain-containing protein n=1 Tax=Frischella japonica TaxID=2741544 RepID=A0ABR7QYY6_9GAMM|nr:MULTISPECIES: hypothetical protein [Frischella]MBC9131436.1 hypothetical protein [Frischella japonica]MBX4133890.1 hypothetical protein [Frischella sp. Ac48]
MASNILTIKCPQCGCIKHSSLGNDKYHCDGCGAIYFIDKNDMHIFHHQQNGPQNTIKSNKLLIIGLIIFFSALFLIRFFVIQIKNTETTQPKVVEYRSYVTSNENRIKPTQPTKKELWKHKNIAMFITNDTPYLIMESHLSISESMKPTQDQYFIKIFNTKTQRFESEFNLIDEHNNKFPYVIKTWDDGEILLLINNLKLFQLNKKEKIFKNVNDSFFSEHPEFSQGLAKIEFVRDDWGSGLYVYTNEGKHFYFYPTINKLYDKDAFFDANSGFKSLPENTATSTGFAFNIYSYEYPDEDSLLIKFDYKYQPNYPREQPSFSWRKFYGTEDGFFTDETPYQKVLMNEWMMNRTRTIKYQNFTPDRVYFFPKLLDFNEEFILIAFTTSPVKAENYIVQLLNAKSAEIIWSYDFPLNFKNTRGKILGDRILLMTDDHLIELNEKGKQTLSLDITSLNN